MKDISVIALFCEDIREEKSGTDTIVGVLPDNLRVPHVPALFPKMCVYLRTNIGLAFDAGPFTTRIVMPGGKEAGRSEARAEVVNSVRQAAQSKGAPYAGFITRFVFAPLHIDETGRILALVTIRGNEYVAGALNIEVAPQHATP
jgi:hypothetical protein